MQLKAHTDDLIQMLLEVNTHISELSASVNTKQDVLEIVPIQLLLGGELWECCIDLIIVNSVQNQCATQFFMS